MYSAVLWKLDKLLFIDDELQQSNQDLFEEAVLNTPMVQDDQENPLKKYFE